MSWFRSAAAVLALATLGTSTNVRAEEDESYVNYDSIVSELKASAGDERPVTAPPDWEDVAVHVGIGLATSFVAVTSPEGVDGAGLLKGFEAHVGVNLFSRVARAEALARSFAQEPIASDLRADLKEFEIRAVFLPDVAERTKMRFGLGIAARNMDVTARVGNRWRDSGHSTASSAFLIGLERKVSRAVSFGPDISYKSTLISDTIDKASWDAAIRLNATF